MWISKQTYQDVQDRLTQAHATVVAETGANKALKESLNWLMLRVTQLEKERAVFVDRLFGVRISVPEISSAEVVRDPFENHPLNDLNSFGDVGNDAAKKLGIDWDEEGKLVYTKQ
jgi:hypothetical protein